MITFHCNPTDSSPKTLPFLEMPLPWPKYCMSHMYEWVCVWVCVCFTASGGPIRMATLSSMLFSTMAAGKRRWSSTQRQPPSWARYWTGRRSPRTAGGLRRRPMLRRCNGPSEHIHNSPAAAKARQAHDDGSYRSHWDVHLTQDGHQEGSTVHRHIIASSIRHYKDKRYPISKTKQGNTYCEDTILTRRSKAICLRRYATKPWIAVITRSFWPFCLLLLGEVVWLVQHLSVFGFVCSWCSWSHQHPACTAV